MAKHSFTADLQCWKEHACTSCGTVYRYLFSRKYESYGAAEEDARARAEKEVRRQVCNDVEYRPCPTCGLVQPEMVGAWRYLWHFLALGFTVLSFIALFITGFFVVRPWLLWIATGVMGVATIWHFLVAQRSFNGDLDGNKNQTRLRMEANELAIVKEGDLLPDSSRLGTGSSAWWLVLLLLATLATPTAELVCLQRGWVWNESWQPGLAGPGDQTLMILPHSIQAIKGMWRANVAAEAVNATELGLLDKRVAVQSQKDDWGNSIQAKYHEKQTQTDLWARITIPEMPEPNGKTLTVKVDMRVFYPAIRENNEFFVAQIDHTHTATLVLADTEAGQNYQTMLWSALILAFVVSTLVGVALLVRAARLQKSGHPQRVFALGGGEIVFKDE